MKTIYMVVTKLDTPKSDYRERIGTEWLVGLRASVSVKVSVSVSVSVSVRVSVRASVSVSVSV